MVAAELDKLAAMDRRWTYLNSIPVGTNDTDIDHLVVGPGGVFTINTKYHRGSKVWVGGDTVMVNGARVHYVRNSRHEARKASKLLSSATRSSIKVRGLIVPVDAASFRVRQQPEDVHVVNRARLTSFLLQQPHILDPGFILSTATLDSAPPGRPTRNTHPT